MRVTQALLLGNYNKFRYDAHEFVIDLFRLERDCINSPLLRMSVLRLLLDKENAATDPLGGYMRLEEIERYFEAMAVGSKALIEALRQLVEYRLIEPYELTADGSIPVATTATPLTPATRIAVTLCGKMHIEMALNDGVYIEQMAQTTPIKSEAIIRSLRDLNRGKMTSIEWRKYKAIFVNYCLEQDRLLMKVPSHTAYNTQETLRREFQNKWCSGVQYGSKLAS